jgi:hypothetical protein
MAPNAEADTCRKYILPKLYAAGWTGDQINEQRFFHEIRSFIRRRGRDRELHDVSAAVRHLPSLRTSVLRCLAETAFAPRAAFARIGKWHGAGKSGSPRKIRSFCRFAAFLPPFEQNDPRPEFLWRQSEIRRRARNDRPSITSSIQSPGGLPRNLTLRTKAEGAQVIEGIDT